MYQQAHISAMQGQNIFVYINSSLAHTETAEKNNLLRGDLQVVSKISFQTMVFARNFGQKKAKTVLMWSLAY